MGRLEPHYQTLRLAEKTCQGQTLQLITSINKLRPYTGWQTLLLNL